MKRFWIVFVVIFSLLGLGFASAEHSLINPKQLEDQLINGNSTPQNIQLMLDNAWENGFDFCRVSMNENGQVIVIEIAVSGLASSLRNMERKTETVYLTQAKESFLNCCHRIGGVLAAAGVEQLDYTVVLLDDVRILQNEYAIDAEIVRVTYSDGQAVHLEATFESWNQLFSENETAYVNQTAATDIFIAEKTPTYILNTNSKKFHLPSCESVSRTKEHNRKEFFGQREEVVSSGYSPCGSCNP